MTDQNKCPDAVRAGMEVISEVACKDGEYEKVDVGDGVLAWIPKEKMEEMGIDPNNPNPDREEAIKSCMEGKWARDMARAMTGPTPSEETLNRVKRNLCEGLID